MTERAPRQKTRGFSIMELLIVVAIILIIGAVAIPNFQKVMAEIRLRSSASAVAGVIQQARIRSVRDNKIYSVAIDTSVTPNMVFVDLNNSGAFNGQEPNASLASDVTYQTICAPCLTAQVIDPSAGGGTAVFYVEPTSAGPMPTFNQRGLPCEPPTPYVGSAIQSCTTSSPTSTPTTNLPVGYAVYLQSTTLGSNGWGAATVTPAGRIKAWSYASGTWN